VTAINASKLAGQLPKIWPLYLLYGEEPLLIQESAQQVCQSLEKQGYVSVETLYADQSFDWGQSLQVACMPSLFATKRVIRLRVGVNLNQQAKETLKYHAQNLPADVILLVECGKLEASSRQGAWFKAINKVGLVVAHWPLNSQELLHWCRHRLQQKGFRVGPEAVSFFAQHIEGNLLAAQQEIEKLSLLYSSGELTLSNMTAAVYDSSRFNIYALADYALQGNVSKVAHVLQVLQRSGEAPQLILWVLLREIRILNTMLKVSSENSQFSQECVRRKIFGSRQQGFKKALGRHSPQSLHKLLQQSATIDGLTKGASGNVWDALLSLSLAMGGNRLWIQ
jgi:DNA polymerase III subunit delta